jgi:hypothetical protein
MHTQFHYSVVTYFAHENFLTTEGHITAYLALEIICPLLQQEI